MFGKLKKKVKKMFSNGSYTIYYNEGEYLQIVDGNLEHVPAYYVKEAGELKQVFHKPYSVSEADSVPDGYSSYTSDPNDAYDKNLHRMLFDQDRYVREICMNIIISKVKAT